MTIAGRSIHSAPLIPSERTHTMGFFAFLLLGLIAGAIAKFILPGNQGGGWFVTLPLGVVGRCWVAG